ncbi:leucyl aminopeptidase [Tsuneonella suprasediminis]|uniref:Probable cytosol aminopeptidase n=1 Tax=Tsuneonella suprasediminis TaxID=2306996 RepID=A0A419QYY4_9SPHN|nr:leucyl aminopeptidase [Tsuneonella suprasediminis]RJX65945.1 leucyl aminopeptidase [Tsuneonella suprasediminis]
MQIEFAPSLPDDARLVARIIDQGDDLASLEPMIAQGASVARFKGSAGQIFEVFADRKGHVVRVALAGAGKADDAERLANCEKAGAALAAKYLRSGAESIAIELTDLTAEEAASVLLGFRLRSWRYDIYRTKLKDDQKATLDSVVVVGVADGAKEAWEEAAAVAKGVELARELVTEPANILYPESYVARCTERFADTGAELIVLDEATMKNLGMGALLGVGQGSIRESRVLAIKWMGGNPDDAPIAFVGKGVTFDTGGISLKPGPGMEDMKWDMGGSAAVVGAMMTLVTRKAPVNVVGVIGLVENMPDGNAQRPGDVVTTMSGQTVEVLNTDAEGRLVLADALTWTQKQFKPAKIVDLATLTGAMMIALGTEHGGCFSNSDELADDLIGAGKATGDKLWRFPLAPAYDKLLDSPIADMKNIGPRFAGSITAAQFLQRYIENDTPWAHLDIAGMVWSEKPGHSWDKGATGFGVRLLDRFVKATAES